MPTLSEKTVGITGSEGLLGWHLRSYLYSRGVTVKTAVRGTFSDRTALAEFVNQSDVIVHFAGMNRGEETEVADTNMALVKSLISACEKAGKKPFVIFASSTQIYKDTAYGRSKKACSERFSAWAEKAGAKFCNLILPNVFGEGGKPFYNSAVSTFCHQIANGLEPKIIVDQEIELVHAQEVAARILAVIEAGQGGEITVKGTPVMVSVLLQKIRGLAGTYKQGLMPGLETRLDFNLFNTYRSYLFPKHYPVALEEHKDERGTLFEAVKSLAGGLAFISRTKPGITRGDHFHLNKIERFLVLNGKARIRIRRLFQTEISGFEVAGTRPQYIDIPTLHTHSISNVGNEDLITLFWAHGAFDPDNPDTFKEKVQVKS